MAAQIGDVWRAGRLGNHRAVLETAAPGTRPKPTIARVDAWEAQRLIDDGTRTLDVLPAAIYEQEHLPGALSMPLETFEPDHVESFDRSAPLLVYCFDQHCDLSARASARLVQLGFERVHDLIGGRAAWTAQGLPTEGAIGDRRRISGYVRNVATVGIDATIADVIALGEQPHRVAVLDDDGILLGSVDPGAAALAPSTRVADVMVPAPGTIRPELRIEEVTEQLRRDALADVFVTAVNGTLLGLVVTDELHV
jgi:rhodanese-related sulfurtransferase